MFRDHEAMLSVPKQPMSKVVTEVRERSYDLGKDPETGERLYSFGTEIVKEIITRGPKPVEVVKDPIVMMELPSKDSIFDAARKRAMLEGTTVIVYGLKGGQPRAVMAFNQYGDMNEVDVPVLKQPVLDMVAQGWVDKLPNSHQKMTKQQKRAFDEGMRMARLVEWTQQLIKESGKTVGV